MRVLHAFVGHESEVWITSYNVKIREAQHLVGWRRIARDWQLQPLRLVLAALIYRLRRCRRPLGIP